MLKQQQKTDIAFKIVRPLLMKAFSFSLYLFFQVLVVLAHLQDKKVGIVAAELLKNTDE